MAGQPNVIWEILNESPLCRQIISFLLKNQNAMDTLRGVATCWVETDEPAALAALDRLIMCGTIITHRRRSGTLYALSPDTTIRNWLREWHGAGLEQTEVQMHPNAV